MFTEITLVVSKLMAVNVLEWEEDYQTKSTLQ